MLIKNLPEGRTLPQLLSTAAAERYGPRTKADRVLRSFDLGRREVETQSLRIAMNEIKNPVTAGVHPGDQIRPRHGALRRDAGGEFPKVALRCQLREVGHLALTHELAQELRVHAIDAQDNQALIAVPLGVRGAAGGQDS